MLRRPARPRRSGGAANNYAILQEFTNDTNKAGGKVDFQLSPALSVFGRYGWRELDTFDQPPHPAAVGRRRQRQHLRAQQAARARRHLGTRATASLLEVRFGWSQHAGPARTRPRSAPRARWRPTASPACRPTRASPAACRRSSSRGYSDLGRQATNPQWQYPTVCNPKVNYTLAASGRHSLKAGYEFQHIETEVQDVNPLYGRDTYTGQFTRPAGAAGQQPLQPRRLHARPALPVRAQQRSSSPTCGRTCTSPTCRTTSG